MGVLTPGQDIVVGTSVTNILNILYYNDEVVVNVYVDFPCCVMFLCLSCGHFVSMFGLFSSVCGHFVSVSCLVDCWVHISSVCLIFTSFELLGISSWSFL